MSDLIRAYGMTMSSGGNCAKCGEPRDKSNHERCDRWPGINSWKRGFRYIGHSSDTTLRDLRWVMEALMNGEDEGTPVQFELRIRQRSQPQQEKADEPR